MAESEKEVEKAPEPKKQIPESKPTSMMQGFLAVLLALLVVAVVFCGVFYFILKNNFYGLGEAFRPAFQNSPILKLALPKVSAAVDPDSPENLTQDQIMQKYIEYRQKVADLGKSIDDAQKKIAGYEGDQKTLADDQAALAENKDLLKSIQDEQKKLDDQKAALDEMVANGDKTGFKGYFSKIDAETAAAIYKELVKEDVNLAAKTELAKPYAAMDAVSAARVLSALWNKDKETAVGVFEGLKSSALALILQNMDPSLAADITGTLYDRKIIK